MKILYGVPSEGMGHATRSKVVIEYLLSIGHDVVIVTSDRAFTFLQQFFGDRVVQIEGFHMAYNNAKVSVKATTIKTIQDAPKQLIKNLKVYFKQLQHQHFDAVISDFESFTNFFANYYIISSWVINLGVCKIIKR